MTPEEQVAILSRGTEEILPEGELLARLKRYAAEKRPLRVKQGFDPTAPDIHLGHSVGLRKLRQFQDLGHQIVLIVGDYTGMVGDPSGVKKTRPQLTPDEIEHNAATYLDQFFRVLERDPRPPRLPVEVQRNGAWFSKMTFMDVMRLASQTTVARVLERDDFAKRYAAQQPISLHELFYPIMVAYDSVAIRADVELGATEQKFNLLGGRVMQELHGQAPQIIMTVPVLPGLDGVERMSKSLGNYIGVSEPPGEMYGKVMSLPDGAMRTYWQLVTDADAAELAAVDRDLADAQVNPMTVKKRLARRIARMYHGEDAAAQAERDFEAQFSRRENPETIEEYSLPQLENDLGDEVEIGGIVDHIVGSGIAETRSAARRLIEQKAVRLNDDLTLDVHLKVRLDKRRGLVLRVGRKLRRYKLLSSK
jgi:tyrosyl-tRNA synthetase